MYRNTLISLAAAAVLATGAAACGQAPSPQASGQPAAVAASQAAAPSAPAAAPTVGRRSASGAAALSVLAEPQAGIGPVYQLITGARSSVDLTMYELNDLAAEADLAADAARGVDVRVILDQHLEKSRNTSAYDYLAAHGVHVAWGPAGTTYHQKTLTIDDATSVIMTLNLARRHRPGLVTDQRAGIHPVGHQRGHHHPGRGERGNGRQRRDRRPGTRGPPRCERHPHHDRRQ
jgi:hypothetical protein